MCTNIIYIYAKWQRLQPLGFVYICRYVGLCMYTSGKGWIWTCVWIYFRGMPPRAGLSGDALHIKLHARLPPGARHRIGGEVPARTHSIQRALAAVNIIIHERLSPLHASLPFPLCARAVVGVLAAQVEAFATGAVPPVARAQQGRNSRGGALLATFLLVQLVVCASRAGRAFRGTIATCIFPGRASHT